MSYGNGIRKNHSELVDLVLSDSDMETFFSFIKENQNNYQIERSIEEREISQTDDQALGKYDIFGPDKQNPQY